MSSLLKTEQKRIINKSFVTNH